MLSQLGQNTISRAFGQARIALETMLPILNELNVLYDAQGGFKETITQADLNAIASFSGLTKAQLDDGMFVLTAVLKPGIANNLTQLAQLATRG